MRITDEAKDALVLLALFVISALPYVGGLGFYSDDWSFLAVMELASDQSFLAIQEQLYGVPNLVPRPLQILQLAASYTLFGLNAFPLHLINHAVIGLAMMVLYFALRRLTIARAVSFSIVAIYLLIPNFSTTRFWFAAFQANVSLLFFAVSLYAAASYVDDRRASQGAMAALGMVLSVLAYEMFLPLFLLIGPALFLARTDPKQRRASVTLFSGALSLVLALALYKLYAAGGERDFHGDLFRATLGLYRAAVKVAVLDFGLKLPFALSTVAARSLGPWPLIAAATNSGICLAWLYVISRDLAATGRSWRLIIGLALFGALCFVGGYGVLLQNFNAMFDPPTGIGNRISIAAAFGVALLVTAAFLAVSRFAGRFAPVASAVLVSMICGSGTLLVGTIGTYWVRSVATQDAIVAGIRSVVPDLRDGDTVLLYGACPSDGPAPVFSSSWDLAGRLQLAYSAPLISADVIKPTSAVTAGAVIVQEYGHETAYPFGRLHVYDATEGRITPIPDAASAEAFFIEHPIAAATGCISIDGGGTPILP